MKHTWNGELQVKQLGTLVIWRMADVSIPYDDLESIAKKTGFDSQYLPKRPQPRHAWERATSLKRQKLIASSDYAAQIRAEYDCEPIVRAETKVINSTTRHLVRSVVIKNANQKERQLDMKSVAILRYNDDATAIPDLDRFESLYHTDFDPLGAVNGNVNALCHRMRLEYERHLTTADGQDIRARLRDYLRSLKATTLADGTYFVPASVAGATDRLAAAQAFILALRKYQVTDNPLTCQIYAVADDGSVVSNANRAEIGRSAIGQYKGRLADLLKRLTEPDGRGAEATQSRVAGASAEFLEVKSEIKLYEQAFSEEFQALADMLKMCQNAMLKVVA